MLVFHTILLVFNNLHKQAVFAEHRAVLSQSVRQELGSNGDMQKIAQGLVKVLISEYEEAFKEILPLNRRHATTYMVRALMWCGNEPAEVESLVRFVVRQWQEIKDTVGLQGRPSIRLFGSAELFQRLRGLQKDGFARGQVKHRFTEDSSPREGW